MFMKYTFSLRDSIHCVEFFIVIIIIIIVIF